MKKATSENLSQKLTRYGTLSLAIAGIANANGQNGYTDINPDEVIAGSGSNHSYDMNMDNLSAPEFKFRQFANYALIAGLQSGASVLGSISGIYSFPYALNSGEVISASKNTWLLNGTYLTLNYASSTNTVGCSLGHWCDATDKYLGLRFKIGANTHYGWARLDIPMLASDGVTIKDYYYNPAPNEAVMAGQFVLGIEENAISKFKIVALRKSIALYNLNESTNFKLYNLSGQAVLEGKTNQNTYVIEANTLTTGIYIIELQDNGSNQILRKKILL